jgi:branched-chain amino acid transport system substrate-binding protein
VGGPARHAPAAHVIDVAAGRRMPPALMAKGMAGAARLDASDMSRTTRGREGADTMHAPVNRRQATLWLAGGLAGASLVACAPSRPKVRVGFLGGLSGSVAELGVQGRNGVLLAIEVLNAGPDGPRFELVARDDQQDPETARHAVAGLASEGVAFVVGPMTSAMAVVAVPVADRLGLVMISPTATTDELSGKADVFFRVAADASYGARQLADASLRAGGHRFAVLLDARNRAYTENFARAFGARVQAGGGSVVATVDYTDADDDFRTLADRLLASKPDAALVVAGVGDSALAAQHLRQRAPKLLLAVSPWAANPRFVELGGSAVEGVIAQQALDLASPAPAFSKFRQRYRDRFGDEATTPAVQAYEAMGLGAAALRETRDGLTLKQVLAQPGRHWPGLYSDIVLDAYGDNDRALHLTQVRDGRFVSLVP